MVELSMLHGAEKHTAKKKTVGLLAKKGKRDPIEMIQ